MPDASRTFALTVQARVQAELDRTGQPAEVYASPRADGWPLVALVPRRDGNSRIVLGEFDREPFEDDSVESHAESIASLIAVLHDEYLNGAPPNPVWDQ
jgi:hypothetical protein